MNEEITDLIRLIKSHLKNHDYKNGSFRSPLHFLKNINGDDQFIYISIQAGELFYSSPRKNVNEFESVEVTFLPFTDILLEPYLDDDSENVCEKIYAYVPIETLAIALYNFNSR